MIEGMVVVFCVAIQTQGVRQKGYFYVGMRFLENDEKRGVVHPASSSTHFIGQHDSLAEMPRFITTLTPTSFLNF